MPCLPAWPTEGLHTPAEQAGRLTPPSSWSPPGAPQGLSPSSRVSLENRGRPLEPGTQWGFGPPSCGRARASGRSARTHGERGWAASPSPSLSRGPDTARSSSCPGAPAAGRYRAGTGAGWGEGEEGPRAPKAAVWGGRRGRGRCRGMRAGSSSFPGRTGPAGSWGPLRSRRHTASQVPAPALPAVCSWGLALRKPNTHRRWRGRGEEGDPGQLPGTAHGPPRPQTPPPCNWPGPLRQG